MSPVHQTKAPSAASILAKARASALLVTNPVNIRYLCGLSMSAGALLVRGRSFILFADGRYLEAAESLNRITVLPAEQLKAYLGKLRTCAIESDYITMARLDRMKKLFPGVRFFGRSSVIEEFRRAKKPEEISEIKKACRITKSVFKQIPALLKPGVRESEISWRIEQLVRMHGAEGTAFDSIVAFGENSARPHHRPGSRRLKKGDIVQIDMGAKVNGYSSDFSRVFFTSPASADQQKVLNALLKAKQAAESLIRPGVSTRLLDRKAREVLLECGYDKEFPHALGHGLGLEIHEGVSISSASPDRKLKAGEVITIEPGLYFPGKWGMRLEDTIIVKSH